MRLKYIVIDGVMPVLFGETLTHQEVAKIKPHLPVTGAGFCSFEKVGDGYNVSCYGSSTSLNIGVGDGDTWAIAKMLEG